MVLAKASFGRQPIPIVNQESFLLKTWRLLKQIEVCVWVIDIDKKRPWHDFSVKLNQFESIIHLLFRTQTDSSFIQLNLVICINEVLLLLPNFNF